MFAKEVNERSPLRILEKSIHGGLGKGNLGVVMARAGVGKTACLVQIGLDALLRGRDVLHVALHQTLEHVQSWYDALFDDLAERTALEDRETVRQTMARHRVIKTFADARLTPDRLENAVELFRRAMSFQPATILIDGFDWTGGEPTADRSSVPVAQVAAALGQFKALARRLGAELWITAQTHRSATGNHPEAVTPPCAAYVDLIDVALFLEPHGDHVELRLLKDHGDVAPPATHLILHCDTMRIVTDEEDRAPRPALPRSAYTLLSGGAPGAEAEFGACAERWGVSEVNYSFAGRGVERTRGLVMLSDAELKQGDVSPAYLKSHMHRTYPDTPLFRRILQSIWHQVATAGEVFTVGVLLEDGTVKGGTGWAAELAKHAKKPVHVYDQERKAWFAWRDDRWTQVEAPVITRSRFAGTGTRFLSDDGRAAIRGLFERTFGPAER